VNGSEDDLARRREMLRALDAEGIMATPLNSAYNELVVEAGRMSILSGGREVVITYAPTAGVAFRKYSEGVSSP